MLNYIIGSTIVPILIPGPKECVKVHVWGRLCLVSKSTNYYNMLKTKEI